MLWTELVQHGRGSFPHGFREPEPESVRFGSCGSGSCGSDSRFRRFAIYLLRKGVFIGEASEHLYWFSSSDSVSHYSRYCGRIGALLGGRTGGGGCKFFRISGACGTEAPNSGRIGALLMG